MTQKKKKQYKDARDRFQQIAGYRAKRIIGFVDGIYRMLPQPSYDITQEDAEKLSTALKESVEPLLEKLDEIAEKGRTVKQKEQQKEVKIF